jgi:hypothetical protein
MFFGVSSILSGTYICTRDEEMKTSDFCDGNVGELGLKYLLDLRRFVPEKLPDNGTLVPKHVGVGT